MRPWVPSENEFKKIQKRMDVFENFLDGVEYLTDSAHQAMRQDFKEHVKLSFNPRFKTRDTFLQTRDFQASFTDFSDL